MTKKATQTAKTTKPVQRRRPNARLLQERSEKENGNAAPSKALVRALEVLDLFEVGAPKLSLTEIANLVDIPGSSLFRLLTILENRGYLCRNEDGTFGLSDTVLFGVAQKQAQRVRGSIHHLVQHLVNRFNETTTLAFLFGDRIEVIDVVESYEEIRVNNTLGRLIPPHCSALGKAIAAGQTPERTERLLRVYGMSRRTENTILDRIALLRCYEEVRRLGYSMDLREATPEGICVGAPIRDQSGAVIAALSVSGPATRMTPERCDAIIPILLATAEAASKAVSAPLGATAAAPSE